MFRKRTTKRYRRGEEKEELLNMGAGSPRLLLIKVLDTVGFLFKAVLLITIISMSIWGIVYAGKSLFLDNKEFELKDIELTTNGAITKQRIVEETRIKKGATLFSLDLEFIETELEKLPEVVEVSAKRKLPNLLKVDVKERTPIAWLSAPHLGIKGKGDSSSMLIGSEGFLLPWDSRLFVKNGMPVITVNEGDRFSFLPAEKMIHDEGMRALELIKLHRSEFRELADSLKSIKVLNFYTLVAEYTDGLTVNFGMHDHRRQLTDLADTKRHASKTGRKLKTLDVRPKSSIPGTFEKKQ